MPGGVKPIDSTLVIVLHNGEQEIERELASPTDALRVALMMLARRGRLDIGDVLKVAPSWAARALATSALLETNNFCRVHKTLRVTPAMVAGVTDRLWEIRDIVGVLEAFENQTPASSWRASESQERAIERLFQSLITSLPAARAGLVKAYAVMAKTRVAAAPDISTVDEAGAPGLYLSSWSGLWAPRNTPKDIVAKLNAAVGDTLAEPVVRSRLTDLGSEIPPRDQQTPEALAALQKAEIEKWWPIIKAANIKAE